MRIMGLDYGDKTVGVAVSDGLLLTAQPVETVKRERANKLRQTYARIEALIQQYDIEKVVVGLPKNMNNEEGIRCAQTREFAETLERRTGLEIIFWDERLTTVAANAVLEEGGVNRQKRKAYIDKIAASMILQGYLDSLSGSTGQYDMSMDGGNI